MAMDGPAAGRPCMSTLADIAAAQEVYNYVQHLRVQDGRRLEIFSRGRGAGEHEYARADNRADAERGQRPRPERFLETLPGLVGIRDQLVDRLAAQKLATRRLGFRLC